MIKAFATLLLCFVALTARAVMNGPYLYAAQNNSTIHVYEINRGHAQVKTFRFSALASEDVRGIAASTAQHRLYIMHNGGNAGHLVCIDLLTDKTLWDRTEYSPHVDRGNITPDGKTIYLPSYEGDITPYISVIDAVTGNLIKKLPQPTGTHDTLCSYDGTKTFQENKNATDVRIHTISTTTNTEVAVTKSFDGRAQPFVVNRANTLLFSDVETVYGFQYADLKTGTIQTANFTGTTHNGLKWPHGIGLKPNEQEVWACDRGIGNHFVHVFDVGALPPVQTRVVQVSNDNPHWLTFTRDGRYCYVAGEKGKSERMDVIDTATYTRVASLAPSEDMLEVDFANGAIPAVGDQFGVPTRK